MARYWARMFAERDTGTTAGEVWDPTKYKYKGDITTVASGTINKNFILPDIEDGPGLNMVAADIPWSISSFGSYGGVRLSGSEVQTVGGNFTTALFSENAEFLLRHALVSYKERNGQPFYAGDTFSFAVSRSFQDVENNAQHELYKGCKFSDVSLSCSDQSPILRANFGIVGSTKEYLDSADTTNYTPEPTSCDQYPSDIFTFQDMVLKFGDSGQTADITVTEIRNLTLNFRNMLDPIFGQKRNVQQVQRTMCELTWQAEFTMSTLGIDSTVATDLKPPGGSNMTDSQWLRYKVENLHNGSTAAAFPIEFKFVSNDSDKELKINIGKSLITSAVDVMPISRAFSVRVGGVAILDSNCNNFSLTFPS
jgi:hypothetical protein